jgi:hypothetical protein
VGVDVVLMGTMAIWISLFEDAMVTTEEDHNGMDDYGEE